MTIPLRHVTWKPCWRIIPARYSKKKSFDRVTDPEDREVIEQLEQMTNERTRQEHGDISLVLPGERVTGPGSAYIMAAFAYCNPIGSRFSDGSFGVYYAARTMETAIEESSFHRENFLRYTKEDPMRLEMLALTADLSGDLHDIRGMVKQFSKVYSRTKYSASQELGIKLRKGGSPGIAYDSVRRQDGECAAIFRPRTLSHCRQERHLIYEWDGKQISKVFELREYLQE
ncbi:MAG: RES family NAD+ phosphorylase [Elusimicrobiota bacterium]|nr:RES family NAD+ phosphorylase [Elusimicrobiota bacterium]